MDLQGTPIGSTNQGMKNTTDPEARNPKVESSGPIASDSLAAESSRSGGAFSSNPNSTPSGMSGANSTYNTTDTSAATTVEPSRNASEREAKYASDTTADDVKGPGGVKYDEGVGGQPSHPGATLAGGYSGGPTSAKYGTASSSSGSGGSTGNASGGESYSTSRDTSSGYGSKGRSGNVDAAPTYVSSVASGSSGKPKGTNLTEGGFEGEARNNDFEIGSAEDPGRAAVQGFQTANASSVGGTGPVQTEITGDDGYDALNSEERA